MLLLIVVVCEMLESVNEYEYIPNRMPIPIPIKPVLVPLNIIANKTKLVPDAKIKIFPLRLQESTNQILHNIQSIIAYEVAKFNGPPIRFGS